MVKRIEFYNYANRGDVFCSRGVVKWMIDNVPVEEKPIYVHHFGEKIVRDLPVKYVPCSAYNDGNSIPRKQRWAHKDGVLSCNVSYMVGTEYFNAGTYAKMLLEALKGELKRELGMTVEPRVVDIIPEILYESYKLDKIDEYLTKCRGRKKVMVCNNDVVSLQAENFDMNPLIESHSTQYPDMVFFVTNKREQNVSAPNVIYIPDLVEEPEGGDLPEASYIGSKCNVILTRGSGPGTFSITRKNVKNENLKFVGFCHAIGPMSFGLEQVTGNKFFNQRCDNAAQAVSFSTGFLKALCAG